MANSREDALVEIARRIRGCFGRVDLKFALHPNDQERAKQLRSITKGWRLGESDIEAAIRPPIQAWIEEGYTSFGENKPQPWHKDPVVRECQITAMVSEASQFLCK